MRKRYTRWASEEAAGLVPRIRGLSPFAGGCVHQESLRLEVVVLKTLRGKAAGRWFWWGETLDGTRERGPKKMHTN